jgi:lipoprotein NlpI
MTTGQWVAVVGAAVLTLCFVPPGHTQVDPAKCGTRGPAEPNERIAGCTAIIEEGTAAKTVLAHTRDLRARAYFEIRDFDHAIADFSELLELSPKEPHAHYNRGVAYSRRGDFDNAITDYGEAIKLDPRYGKAYLCRGDAYQAKGDFDGAIADYDQAVQLDPKYKEAYLERGIAYSAKGELDHAISDYDQAIQLDPNFKIAYLRRGSAYRAKGDTDRAIADYDDGIRLDPKYAGAYRARGVAEFQAGSFAKSLADLDRSQELDPKDSYIALLREIVARRSDQPSRLTEATTQLDMTIWPGPVVRLFLGQIKEDAVLAAADDSNPKKQKEQVCDANFYIGELAQQRGLTDEAMRLLRFAATNCSKNSIEWSAAKAELKALGFNP